MSQAIVSATEKVNAPAAVVYGILADYDHHRRILPPKYFTNLTIEEGGVGAGTRLAVTIKAMGQQQTFHMLVSEPEPGVVLAETEVNTGLVTTFTVKPIGDAQSEVTIRSVWQPQPGLAGVMDRLVTPLFTRHIYRQELRLLDQYAQQQVQQPAISK